MGKCSLEQVRVAAEMVFEQIDAAAVEGHGWGVGQLESVLDVEFEDVMLGRWVAAVGLEDDIDRREALSVVIVSAFDALRRDYPRMIEDGLLFDEAESFETLMSRCATIQALVKASRAK